MAIYSGTYHGDSGVIQKAARLQVYSVIDGSRVNTSLSFDDNYLPPVFKVNTVSAGRGFRGCDYSVGQVRYARLYLNGSDYLHVDLPFIPGSSEYDQFFIAVSFNTAVVTVGLEGERVNSEILRYKVDARG
jgi:hypothetical protein